MKRNLVFRIVFYSVCILLLLAALLSGMGFSLFRFRDDPVQHTDNTGSGTADPTLIRGIEIDWAAGSITIRPSPDAEEIRFSESAAYNNIDPMVWEIEDGTLSIDFCEDSLQFGITVNYSKDLLIEVPESWLCRELEINAASAEVRIADMSIDSFDFDGASAECTLENCTVNTMDVDAASGDVYFQGSLNEVDFDGASAKCILALSNCPRSIHLNGLSGDLDITLPYDCGFTVTTTGHTQYKSEFEMTASPNQDQFIYGDGSCRITLNAVSGNVNIRKGSELCADHHH